MSIKKNLWLLLVALVGTSGVQAVPSKYVYDQEAQEAVIEANKKMLENKELYKLPIVPIGERSQIRIAEKEKKIKNLKDKKERKEMAEATFMPIINAKSRKIVDSKIRKDTVNRLYGNKPISKQEKEEIEKKEIKEEREKMKPVINEYSKKIIADKGNDWNKNVFKRLYPVYPAVYPVKEKKNNQITSPALGSTKENTPMLHERNMQEGNMQESIMQNPEFFQNMPVDNLEMSFDPNLQSINGNFMDENPKSYSEVPAMEIQPVGNKKVHFDPNLRLNPFGQNSEYENDILNNMNNSQNVFESQSQVEEPENNPTQDLLNKSLPNSKSLLNLLQSDDEDSSTNQFATK